MRYLQISHSPCTTSAYLRARPFRDNHPYLQFTVFTITFFASPLYRFVFFPKQHFFIERPFTGRQLSASRMIPSRVTCRFSGWPPQARCLRRPSWWSLNLFVVELLYFICAVCRQAFRLTTKTIYHRVSKWTRVLYSVTLSATFSLARVFRVRICISSVRILIWFWSEFICHRSEFIYRRIE